MRFAMPAWISKRWRRGIGENRSSAQSPPLYPLQATQAPQGLAGETLHMPRVPSCVERPAGTETNASS